MRQIDAFLFSGLELLTLLLILLITGALPPESKT